MIDYGIEFHNVDHLEDVEGMGGKKLCRFPRDLSRNLGVAENRNARFRADRAHGCELRFVTESKYFDVALTAVEQDSAYYRHYRSFKKTVRQTVLKVGDHRFHLVKGEEILKNFTYLSTDLLHPSDNGHIRMGANLADQLTGRGKGVLQHERAI